MLELVRVSKHYGATRALDGLSFTVPAGQMFGFVGTNGAGKTTAMRIILGVLDADAGEVRWQGQRVGAASRRGFGYMPEERGLYPKMRVLDQLVYLAELRGVPTAAARAATLAWLERLGVAERARDRVEALSLGNQQRVQLAAALVHDPDLLVLDEPFSGLDPVGVDVLAAALRQKVDQGAAVVFSSHQLELVERLCDAVGIIQGGRMVATGSVASLRRGSTRRFQLRMHAAHAAGWPEDLAAQLGGSIIQRDNGSLVWEIPEGADDQVLLRAALAHGQVRAFTPILPSLTELFRDAVGAPVAAAASREGR